MACVFYRGSTVLRILISTQHTLPLVLPVIPFQSFHFKEGKQLRQAGSRQDPTQWLDFRSVTIFQGLDLSCIDSNSDLYNQDEWVLRRHTLSWLTRDRCIKTGMPAVILQLSSCGPDTRVLQSGHSLWAHVHMRRYFRTLSLLMCWSRAGWIGHGSYWLGHRPERV